MSAYSTVGDVFSDTEFSANGDSFLWGLGALEEPNRERTGFLIMPKRPYDWRVDTHGCCKYDNSALRFGPRDQTAHLPVFLAPTASCSVNMRNKEGLSADTTNKSVRRHDVLDCDVVHRSHFTFLGDHL